MWIAGIIGIIAVLIVGRIVWSSKKLRALRSDAEKDLAELFGTWSSCPKVNVKWSYGYPYFQVTFPSNEMLADARSEGITQMFLDRIQERCKAFGPRKRPFDASRCVWFTSTEELGQK